ncbi:hypothetical protein BC629DRAFT_1450852 [Irpex lacteus]|nr:hypothetical protein BC629DRAFT_1450852 [Irpex lacteus]
MTWSLPPELDDIILDYLYDDPTTLSRCALVQKSWLPAARYHLWSNLRLNCASDELTKLRTLLTSTSPAVGFYIRSVVVLQKKGEACQWYDLNLLHYTLSVLSLLPNLRTLTLDGLWFGAPKRNGLGIPFDEDSEQTAEVPIASGIVSSSVEKLAVSTCSFDNFEDVQQLCLSFPSLSRLQFDGVWWGRWAHEPSQNHRALSDVLASSVAPKMVLRELDLGSCFSRDRVIEWLLDATPANVVETLKLPLIGAYDTRLRELLASMEESLRHLEIGSPSTSHSKTRNTSTPTRALESYLDLAPLTALRTITLGVPTYRDPSFITTWLHSILAQISSTHLEEVRFAVYPILRGDAADAESMLSSFGWSELGKVIAEMPQFGRIRRVVFTAGRSTDYLQIPGAFVDLGPLLSKVIPTVLDVDELSKKGIEVAYRSV